jgi:hypothetical protein
VAAATGIKLAALNYGTLVMSIDHSPPARTCPKHVAYFGHGKLGENGD